MIAAITGVASRAIVVVVVTAVFGTWQEERFRVETETGLGCGCSFSLRMTATHR